MPEHGLLRFIYRWRVRISLLFVIAAIALANPSLWSLLAGAGLTALGLLVRTWACGHLEKEKKLTVSGPYRYTRNPLYFGNLLIGTGVAIGARSWWVLPVLWCFLCFFIRSRSSRKNKKWKSFFPRDTQHTAKGFRFFYPSFGHLCLVRIPVSHGPCIKKIRNTEHWWVQPSSG